MLSVGEKIRKYRKDKNFTQRKLAEMIDMSHSMLSNYENGQAVPSVVTLRKIAEALQLNNSEAADLFGVPSEKEKEKQKQENSFDYSLIFENSLHFKAYLRSCAKYEFLENVNVQSMLDKCKFSDNEKSDCMIYYISLKALYDIRNNDELSRVAYRNFLFDLRNLYQYENTTVDKTAENQE